MIDNNLWVLSVYNEVLKVCIVKDILLEYVIIIFNKVNLLYNLFDNLEKLEVGNYYNLFEVKNFYGEV